MQSPNLNINLPLNIRIKINEENNVIFLRCNGFQTEIFMPTILDGRLQMINIVPSRRCKCYSTSHIVSKNSAGARNLALDANSPSMCHSRMSKEFYTSTPERRNVCKSVLYKNTNQLKNIVLSSSVSENPTQAKSKSPEIGDIVVFVDNDVSNETELDTIRREKTLELSAPEALRTAMSNNNVSGYAIVNGNLEPSAIDRSNDQEILLDDYSIATPIGPCPTEEVSLLLSNLSSIENARTLSPKATHQEALTACTSLNQTPNADSPVTAQWHNVRTYSRYRYSPNKSVSISSKSNLDNSTQGVPASKRIKSVKQSRKAIIVDKNLVISPKSFKQRFQNANIIGLRLNLRKELLQRNLPQYKKKAYEFFTTLTSQSKCIASELKEMFYLRCINKGSSTYPKYKKLAGLESRLTGTARARTKAITSQENLDPGRTSVSQYTLVSVDEC